MAEVKTVSIVALNGSNYPTWKLTVQNGTDERWSMDHSPPEHETDRYRKFAGRRDCALTIIVLSIEPSLLYLIEDPNDPNAVWRKLADQFQKKTWAKNFNFDESFTCCI